jgi:phosphoglycolate phosphatase
MVDPQICRVILSENGFSEKAQDALLPKVIVRMGEIYKAMTKHVVLNTGVRDLLRILFTSQSHVLGVLTGNVSSVGEEKLSVAGIRSYFADRFYADSCFDRSALAKNAVEACMNKYRLPSQENVVIVGDTPLDIECAKNAKAKSVGIASGAYSTEDLYKAGADSVFCNLSPSKELLEMLDYRAAN